MRRKINYLQIIFATILMIDFASSANADQTALVLVNSASPNYTDYQHYFVPDNVFQNEAMLVSPLADKFVNGLALGYFQIDSNGTIITPYQQPGQSDINPQLRNYLLTLENDLLPSLDGQNHLEARRIALSPKPILDDEDEYKTFGRFVGPRDRSVSFRDVSNTCRDCIVYLLQNETSAISKKEIEEILSNREDSEKIGTGYRACILKISSMH